MQDMIDIGFLTKLVSHQIKNVFFCTPAEKTTLQKAVREVLPSVTECFSAISNKYYYNNGMTIFNPYHSGQYGIFLYFLARHVWENHQQAQLADKLYCLNKMLNGCDIFYQVKLPAVFFHDHPVGTVIGRGSFSNYLVYQQNCTIGGNKEDVYPVFGEYVSLFTNAVVVGSSHIGNNVFIAAGTYVKDTNIPDNSIVFGRSPNLVVRQKPPEFFYAISPFRIHHRQ